MSKKIKKQDVEDWDKPIEPWDPTTETGWEDPLKDWDSSVEEFNVKDIKDYPLDLDKLDTPKEGKPRVKQQKTRSKA